MIGGSRLQDTKACLIRRPLTISLQLCLSSMQRHGDCCIILFIEAEEQIAEKTADCGRYDDETDYA